jgi:signal transduction histidine kinase
MQDEERRRIARELHDSAGQITVALDLNLASILAEAKSLSPKAEKACREASELAQQLSGELRTISHLLHPPLLDEAGLPSAVTWLVDGFAERSKISVKLDLGPDLGRFSPEVETALFRVVQECLTNIHRHSESRAATVHIARDADEVKVEVRDQGKGMPSGSNGSRGRGSMGVGIQGMRERITQLGGRFEIHSGKNGTAVVASVPVLSSPVQTTAQIGS